MASSAIKRSSLEGSEEDILDLDKWREAKRRRPAPQDFVENRLFYQGDHWQKGTQWVGPQVDLNADGGRELWAELQRAFVSKNLVKECVNRHAGAVIGQEPHWGFTVRRPLDKIERLDEYGFTVIEREAPTDEEQALIDEAEAVLTSWWDNRKVMANLVEAAQTLGWASNAPIRLYTPPAVLNSDGNIDQAPLEESINKIYFLALDPAQSGVLVDEHGVEIGAYYQYSVDGVNYEERVFLNDEAETVIAIYKDEALIDYVVYDLGGRLTIQEMNRDSLVLPSVKQNQNLVNMAKTMMSRNVVLGGFLERLIFNAQMPGEFKMDPETKRRIFVPDKIQVGAGTTNVLSGIQETDDEGRPTGKLASPSVHYRDPVPVTTFIDTKTDAQYDIYSEFSQLHVLMVNDSTATGVSRQQAVSDFEASIEPTQREIERALRWLLETVLKMAAVFSGEPNKFDELRAVAECRVSTSKPTVEEQNLAIQQKNAQIISLETAMTRSGIDDPDAEKAVISNEQRELFSLLQEQQIRLNGDVRSGALPEEPEIQ